eukprot:TRINITY_DN3024_c0_g1_i4.p1 TRINITY_DN3024_c0_g1~~TRINITY_DN3024_c0_g1_i4.p1  ORF type:complete len:887 (+),score=231.64 TRINITY_DN3024_c0_g1_i4:102-2663(+)
MAADAISRIAALVDTQRRQGLGQQQDPLQGALLAALQLQAATPQGGFAPQAAPASDTQAWASWAPSAGGATQGWAPPHQPQPQPQPPAPAPRSHAWADSRGLSQADAIALLREFAAAQQEPDCDVLVRCCDAAGISYQDMCHRVAARALSVWQSSPAADPGTQHPAPAAPAPPQPPDPYRPPPRQQQQQLRSLSPAYVPSPALPAIPPPPPAAAPLPPPATYPLPYPPPPVGQPRSYASGSPVPCHAPRHGSPSPGGPARCSPQHNWRPPRPAAARCHGSPQRGASHSPAPYLSPPAPRAPAAVSPLSPSLAVGGPGGSSGALLPYGASPGRGARGDPAAAWAVGAPLAARYRDKLLALQSALSVGALSEAEFALAAARVGDEMHRDAELQRCPSTSPAPNRTPPPAATRPSPARRPRRRLRTLSDVGDTAAPFVGVPGAPLQNLVRRFGVTEAEAAAALSEHGGHAGRAARDLERRRGAAGAAPPPETAAGASSSAPERTASQLGKVEQLFRHFDRDRDGLWCFAEARRFMLAVSGLVMERPEWEEQCAELGCDPDRGLPLEVVRDTYDVSDVEDDYQQACARIEDIERRAVNTMLSATTSGAMRDAWDRLLAYRSQRSVKRLGGLLASGMSTGLQLIYFRKWDAWREDKRDRQREGYQLLDPSGGAGGDEWEEGSEEAEDEEWDDGGEDAGGDVACSVPDSAPDPPAEAPPREVSRDPSRASSQPREARARQDSQCSGSPRRGSRESSQRRGSRERQPSPTSASESVSPPRADPPLGVLAEGFDGRRDSAAAGTDGGRSAQSAAESAADAAALSLPPAGWAAAGPEGGGGGSAAGSGGSERAGTGGTGADD